MLLFVLLFIGPNSTDKGTYFYSTVEIRYDYISEQADTMYFRVILTEDILLLH